MSIDNPKAKYRYIRWRDVTIVREVDALKFTSSGYYINEDTVIWTATFSGRGRLSMISNHSDIPIIEFSSEGRTIDEASNNLIEIAEEQGFKFS